MIMSSLINFATKFLRGNSAMTFQFGLKTSHISGLCHWRSFYPLLWGNLKDIFNKIQFLTSWETYVTIFQLAFQLTIATLLSNDQHLYSKFQGLYEPDYWPNEVNPQKYSSAYCAQSELLKSNSTCWYLFPSSWYSLLSFSTAKVL